ncbi:hypothetical protein HDU98_006722 [Podochytrium sp. JEL0797]|nr:hypothetical protein HDU98_006722 [Podochytrium sp. JEL0797]
MFTNDQLAYSQQQPPINIIDVSLLQPQMNPSDWNVSWNPTRNNTLDSNTSIESNETATSTDPPSHSGSSATTSRKRRTTRVRSPLDSDDETQHLTRRQKNTEAARRSRARKLDHMVTLEQKVVALEEEKVVLGERIVSLEGNARTFEQMEMMLKERVTLLEQQLADNYKAFLGM